MAVGDQLNFDVPRPLDKLFDKHPRVAETGLRLAAGPLETVAALVVVVGHPHTLAAAAGAGLEHHRVADVARRGHRLVGVGQRLGKPRYHIDAGLFGNFFRADFVAHRLDGSRRRADKSDPGVGQGGGKSGVLR